MYVFGMTGPAFGTFQVAIDDAVVGVYNASSSLNTYDTLLFFVTHLDPDSPHKVVLTNQADGLLFALDYIVAVSSGAASYPDGQIAGHPPPQPQPTAVAVFPGQGAAGSQVQSTNSTGKLIGGILGALAALVGVDLEDRGGVAADAAGPLMVLVSVLSMEEEWGRRRLPDGTVWTTDEESCGKGKDRGVQGVAHG
jgi:hypothetical protein